MTRNWDERYPEGSEPELWILAAGLDSAEEIQGELEQAFRLEHYYRGREPTLLAERNDGLRWVVFHHSSECGDGLCEALPAELRRVK